MVSGGASPNGVSDDNTYHRTKCQKPLVSARCSADAGRSCEIVKKTTRCDKRWGSNSSCIAAILIAAIAWGARARTKTPAFAGSRDAHGITVVGLGISVCHRVHGHLAMDLGQSFREVLRRAPIRGRLSDAAAGQAAQGSGRGVFLFWNAVMVEVCRRGGVGADDRQARAGLFAVTLRPFRATVHSRLPPVDGMVMAPQSVSEQRPSSSHHGYQLAHGAIGSGTGMTDVSCREDA
jgi:hypothetical protein